jgi:hypothetical protein
MSITCHAVDGRGVRWRTRDDGEINDSRGGIPCSFGLPGLTARPATIVTG